MPERECPRQCLRHSPSAVPDRQCTYVRTYLRRDLLPQDEFLTYCNARVERKIFSSDSSETSALRAAIKVGSA